jgi:hypothetical protein
MTVSTFLALIIITVLSIQGNVKNTLHVSHYLTDSLNNNGSLILSGSSVKYPCAPRSQALLGNDPDAITYELTSAGDATGSYDLSSDCRTVWP